MENSKLVGTQDIGSPMAFANALSGVEPEPTTEPTEPTPEPTPESTQETIQDSTPEPPVQEEVTTKETVEVDDNDSYTDNTPDETPQVEDNPYNDYTEAALVLEAMKQQGRLPQDLEVKKDMDWAAFMDTIDSDANSRYSGAINQYLDSLEREREYVEFRLNGGSRQTMDKALDIDSLVNLPTEGDTEEVENNRKLLITRMYKEQGLPEETIEELVETFQVKEKDIQEAEKAKQYLSERKKQMLENEKAYIAQQEAEERLALEAQQKEMRDIISSGDLGSVSLETDQEKRDLIEALFTPSVPYTYTDEQGKKQTARITLYQKKLQEFNSSTKQQLLFAKLLVDGFDSLQSVKNQAAREKDMSILDLLNGKTTRRRTTKRKEEVFPMDQLADTKEVFTMDI